MRLQVGVLGAEQLRGPRDADLLGPVHHLAAAVVAPAGIALGVLVGQRGAERGQHGRAGQVLAGDQLQPAAQPFQLVEDHLGDLRILLAQGVEVRPPERGALLRCHNGSRYPRWGAGPQNGVEHCSLLVQVLRSCARLLPMSAAGVRARVRPSDPRDNARPAASSPTTERPRCVRAVAREMGWPRPRCTVLTGRDDLPDPLIVDAYDALGAERGAGRGAVRPDLRARWRAGAGGGGWALAPASTAGYAAVPATRPARPSRRPAGRRAALRIVRTIAAGSVDPAADPATPTRLVPGWPRESGCPPTGLSLAARA